MTPKWPKRNRKEMAFAIFMDMSFEKTDHRFTLEEFKEIFNKAECVENNGGISFPLGTVTGDVENLLEGLMSRGLLRDEGNGTFLCQLTI